MRPAQVGTARVFKGFSKQVTVQANPNLFAGKVFYLEIFFDGKVAHEYFEKLIREHGGKLSRRLGKHVTHLVWSEGRKKTLRKALEFDSIYVISTLWF